MEYPKLGPVLEAILTTKIVPFRRRARLEGGCDLLVAAPQGANKLAGLCLALGQPKKGLTVDLAAAHPADGYASWVAIYPEALGRGEELYAA